MEGVGLWPLHRGPAIAAIRAGLACSSVSGAGNVSPAIVVLECKGKPERPL